MISEFRWWESPAEQLLDAKWNPPVVPDLLECVRNSNSLFIKQPFHHIKYPLEYKTSSYYTHKGGVEPTHSDDDPQGKTRNDFKVHESFISPNTPHLNYTPRFQRDDIADAEDGRSQCLEYNRIPGEGNISLGCPFPEASDVNSNINLVEEIKQKAGGNHVVTNEDGLLAPEIMNIELSSSPQLTTYKDLFRKKSLRQRIYDGEVMFYEDYVESELVNDYIRLFNRPFNIPRHDWGGSDYFFGKKVELGSIPGARNDCVTDSNDGPNIMNSQITSLESTPNNSDHNIREYYDETQRNEMPDDMIPSLFSKLPQSSVKQKSRKVRWVSFNNLRTYGRIIDSVTKCPLLHVQLQSALQAGWHHKSQGAILKKVVESDGKKGPYHVTREIIDRANEIIRERRNKVDDYIPDVNALFKNKLEVNENFTSIGGGRYQI